jgi:hypothetical protein
MSVEKTSNQFPSIAASFNSSGNFTVPSSVSKVYVTLRGAAGGNHNLGYTGGAAAIGGGYVAVAGGATYPIAIGAQGAAGTDTVCIAYVNVRYSGCSGYSPQTSGASGGTTTFDSSAIVVYGGGGAAPTSSSNTTGSVAFDTSLPALYPSGAVARVSGTSTAASTSNVNGQAYIFTVPS